jgi:hypothetical protein
MKLKRILNARKMLALLEATHIFATIVVWNAMLGKRALIARAGTFCRSTSSVATVVVGPGTFKSFPQGI